MTNLLKALYTRLGAIAVLGGLCAGSGRTAQIGGPGVTATTSVAEVDTLVTTPVTKTVNTWSLELKALLPGGPVLFDQIFSVPFADPLFQSGIGQAEGVLSGAGALAFSGPTLLSSSQSLVSSLTNTVVTGQQTTQTFIGTGDWIGPAALLVGDFGICQSYTFGVGNGGASGLTFTAGNYALPTGCSPGGQPFNVPFGGVDIDAATLSLVTISQTATTTNTFLTTQVYELDGLTSSAATPEPGSAALLLLGLLGLGAAGCGRRPSNSFSSGTDPSSITL